ncbi:proteinase-activated receptor 4-like [Engraulis encrasicolus]|uniref:proteinase-activated receptor 4-like n=1 Tax=Engraulis encrasicolus TaxID=184585 RepID=UPI002FD4BF5A
MPPRLWPSTLELFSLLLFASAFQFQSVSSETDSSECKELMVRSYGINRCGEISTADKERLMSHKTTVVLPSLYLVALVLGLPSNLLALWVLLFRTKKKPSTILLINLTTCDLLLLVVLPFRIAYHFKGNNWTLGEPFCRLVIALFYGNMYGSIMCLALIAFDRYLAVVHPMVGMSLRSRLLSMCMSVAMWAVMLTAMAPLLATQQIHPIKGLNVSICHDALPSETQRSFFLPYFASLFSVCFVLPLLVMIVCNACVIRALVKAGKRYKHAAFVTVLVMVVCLVCLLPSNVLLIFHNLHWLAKKEIEDKPVSEPEWDPIFGFVYKTTPSPNLTSENSENNLYNLYMLSLALATFNSCLDPFIYYYVSEEFREKARQVLCCKDPPKPNISSQQDTSMSTMSYRTKVTTCGDLLSTSGKLSMPTDTKYTNGRVVA